MQLAALFQSFDGGDLLAFALAEGGGTRPGRPAVDDDRAGPAAALAAAVFAPGQIQLIAQDAEQAPSRVGLGAVPGSVDVQFSDGGHRSLLRIFSARGWDRESARADFASKVLTPFTLSVTRLRALKLQFAAKGGAVGGRAARCP